MDSLEQDRIEKVVDLAAPIARVWRALTDHEEFGEWFRVRLDGPFRLGETTTGNITYPGYEHMKWVSVTERIEHERLFAFSWPPSAIDPDTTYDEGAKVTVEFRLESIDIGTATDDHRDRLFAISRIKTTRGAPVEQRRLGLAGRKHLRLCQELRLELRPQHPCLLPWAVPNV